MILIALITIAVYSSSVKNGFVSYDDFEYVVENPNIKDFSLSSVLSMFSTFYKSNYHPLTTLSYAVEYRMAGESPAIYHIDNLLLHLLNSLLLFLFISRLSNNIHVAFFTAVLFSVHPMHVESVAWISSRKDLLFSFFSFLALLSYMKYKTGKGKCRAVYYMSLMVLFSCSLLSKSAAVVFPFVLLLVDYYKGWRMDKNFIKEKLPIFFLAVLGGIVAIVSQYTGGAITSQEFLHIPYFQRIFIASYSFWYYLFEMIVPVHLSAFHPFPVCSTAILPFKYYMAFTALIVFVLLIVSKWKKLTTEIRFAILYYSVSVILILQLIPFGHAMLAERYTYAAYTGPLFLVVITLFSNNRNQNRYGLRKIFSIISLIVVIIVFSFISVGRIRVWKNSLSLFSDIIAKYPYDTHGYMFRADQFFKQGDLISANKDYDHSIALDDDNYLALHNRAVLFFNKGMFNRALHDLNKVIELKPDYAHAYQSRASLKRSLGDMHGALRDYNKLISIDPNNGEAYFLRSGIYFGLKDIENSCRDLQRSQSLGYKYAKYILKEKCN